MKLEDSEKRGQSAENEKIVAQIIKRDLRGEAVGIRELAGGYYGRVYAVDAAASDGGRKVVVKLVDAGDDPPFDKEPGDNRVYGGRWSNLKPAHDLLTAHGLPVSKLYACGCFQGKDYAVMEFLKGASVKEFIACDSHAKMDDLHRLAGETMRLMHRITRDYQGWIDMDKKYSRDWEESFFKSLESRLSESEKKNPVIDQKSGLIREFIVSRRGQWRNPEAFVFSHPDGFQGIAEYEKNKWILSGIIDVEDHQFTDPRFVLAGYELELEFEGRPLPAAFWEGYNKNDKADGGYGGLKDLFKLYYLLSWLPGAYDNWRGKPEEQSKCVKRFEGLTMDLISKKARKR